MNSSRCSMNGTRKAEFFIFKRRSSTARQIHSQQSAAANTTPQSIRRTMKSAARSYNNHWGSIVICVRSIRARSPKQAGSARSQYTTVSKMLNCNDGFHVHRYCLLIASDRSNPFDYEDVCIDWSACSFESAVDGVDNVCVVTPARRKQ